MRKTVFSSLIIPFVLSWGKRNNYGSALSQFRLDRFPESKTKQICLIVSKGGLHSLPSEYETEIILRELRWKGKKKKKRSVVFPCKAQSMVEACFNGKSHFRLQFSEYFYSFFSMHAEDQHSQSQLNVSMVFLSLIPAGSLNKLQKQSIVLRVCLLWFDLYWSFFFLFFFQCAILLLSSSSLHLPSAWDLILDLITPSFLLPQGDCIMQCI